MARAALARVAARRAMFSTLHASALTGAVVAFVCWVVFRPCEAVLVAGAGGIAAGFLALLARRCPLGTPPTTAIAQGFLLEAYAVALLAVGGALLRVASC